MSDKENNEQSERNIGKLLRQLPKVKASPDFEARLRRRIAESAPAEKKAGLFGFFSFPGRIPVVATSVIALIAVSILSYYLFLKTGTLPPGQDVATRQAPEFPKNVMRQDTAETFSSLEDKGKKDALIEESKVPLGESKKAKVVSQPPATLESASGEREAGVGQGMEQMTAPERYEQDEKALQTQEPAREMAVPEPEVTLQKRETVQERMLNKGSKERMMQSAPQFQSLQTSKPLIITSSPVNELRKDSLIISPLDSIKADSLRRDSIQKAQQQVKKPKP